MCLEDVPYNPEYTTTQNEQKLSLFGIYVMISTSNTGSVFDLPKICKYWFKTWICITLQPPLSCFPLSPSGDLPSFPRRFCEFRSGVFPWKLGRLLTTSLYFGPESWPECLKNKCVYISFVFFLDTRLFRMQNRRFQLYPFSYKKKKKSVAQKKNTNINTVVKERYNMEGNSKQRQEISHHKLT